MKAQQHSALSGTLPEELHVAEELHIARVTSGRDRILSASPSTIQDAAWRIGLRLVREAQWSAQRCTWTITTSDPDNVWSRQPLSRPAGPWIYQGAAGVALFLSELYASTGDSRVLPCIEGALEYALDCSDQNSKSQIGFHTGFAGIGYALVRHGIATDRGAFIERGLDLLASLDLTPAFLDTTDVVSGAAGAIPILLAIAQWTDSSVLRDSAFALGSRVARAATRWPVGWSWPSAVATNVRDLTGLAHGAAGFGHAFVELYAASGESAFKYAAEQAFAYEDSFFDDSVRNWPDFRNGQLAEILASEGKRSKFAERLRTGEEYKRSQPVYVRSWCHGAPGIGLTRLRAFEVFGSERYRSASELALATTAAASQELLGYSLCHGVFGNDETLIQSSRVLGEPQWTTGAFVRAVEAVERYEKNEKPWPSGVLGNLPDPSLMLGDAGIGYHLLRLADPSVPSILLPIATLIPQASILDRNTPNEAVIAAQRREHVRVFFAQSMDVTKRLGFDSLAKVPEGDNVVLRYADAVRAIRSDHHTHMIADVMSVELTRLEMIMSITDVTDTLIEELRRVPAIEVEWQVVKLSLTEFARLITQERDWAEWLKSPTSSDFPRCTDPPIHFLLLRRAGAVTVRRLNALSAGILSGIEGGATVHQLCEAVRDAIDIAVPEVEVEQVVLRTVVNAYEAGIITVTRQNGAARSTLRQ